MIKKLLPAILMIVILICQGLVNRGLDFINLKTNKYSEKIIPAKYYLNNFFFRDSGFFILR
jgi:hypothetical protein